MSDKHVEARAIARQISESLERIMVERPAVVRLFLEAFRERATNSARLESRKAGLTSALAYVFAERPPQEYLARLTQDSLLGSRILEIRKAGGDESIGEAEKTAIHAALDELIQDYPAGLVWFAAKAREREVSFEDLLAGQMLYYFDERAWWPDQW